jgi:hypothetical protein
MHMDHHGGPRSPFAIHPGSPHSAGSEAGSESLSTDQRDDRLDRMSNAEPSDNVGLLPSQIAAVMAENHELRAEVERLRAERARLSDIQTRLMDAIGCKSPERLVHDVRNVLNERELYRALADTIQD